MYTGEVSVQQDRLPLFLQLAEKLQVAGLTQTKDENTEDMFENDKMNIDIEKQLKEEKEVFMDPSVIKSEVAEASNNYSMYVYEGYDGYDDNVEDKYYDNRYDERITGEE